MSKESEVASKNIRSMIAHETSETHLAVSEVLYWAWEHSLQSDELAEHLDLSDAEMKIFWERVNRFKRTQLQ